MCNKKLSKLRWEMFKNENKKLLNLISSHPRLKANFLKENVPSILPTRNKKHVKTLKERHNSLF